MRKTKLVTVCTLSVVAAMCFCGDPVPVEPIADSQMLIASMTASYDAQRNVVLLAWTPAPGVFDFYRIYRTSKTDTLGNPDMETLQSTLIRDSIGSGQASFEDVPDLDVGTHFYGIVAVRRGPDGEEFEGQLSPIGPTGAPALVRVVVGDDVVFTINRGELDTDNKLCSLFVFDSAHAVQSLRFTQIKVGQPPDGGAQPVFDNDPFGQVRDLVAYGLLDVDSTLPDTGTPDFSVSDAYGNTNRAVYDPNRGLFAQEWTLLPFAGRKTVWVEVRYADGRVDTIPDLIRTKPHKVDLVLRNSTAAVGGSVKDTSVQYISPKGGDTTSIRMLVLYNNTIRFSVKNYGDEGIEPEFEYWLVTNQFYAEATKSLLNKRGSGWLMTMPQKASLTGRGDLHEQETEYVASVDTNLQLGRNTLDSLLFGLEGESDSLGSVRDYALNRELFDYMRSQASWDYGRKQVLLVARFTESSFGGQFIRVFGLAGPEDEEARLFRDAYMPLVLYNNSERNPYALEEGDFINGPFTFALDTSSVRDGGLARVTSVRLVIGRLPDGYVWDSLATPLTMTPETVYGFNHEILDFPIDKPSSLIKHVIWEDIDPRSWTSGYYVFGVVVTDDRGNEGFAGVDAEVNLRNPFRVYISTNN